MRDGRAAHLKLLITGATGFIGRRALVHLAERGQFEIIACSRSMPIDLPKGVRHESVDLLAPGSPAGLIERTRPTHLLHLAWNAEPGRFWTALDNLDWSAATLSLFRAFVAFGGRRAVMAGTCAEYEWTSPGVLREDAPVRPATLYGVAKDATRRLASSAGTMANVSVAWGRVFWLYGPQEANGRLVSDTCRSLAQGRPIETSEGLQERDFLHVDDVARAFSTALLVDWSGAFNIGSGELVTVRRIVETLATAAGRPDLVRFGARKAPEGEPPRLGADITILRDKIGFSPSIDLDEGLTETLAWWRRAAGDRS